MKLMNYDVRELIAQNMRCREHTVPITYTKAQYNILCRLIRQKKITKPFFDLLLAELYGLSDWKKLTYSQMYELLHILTWYNY